MKFTKVVKADLQNFNEGDIVYVTGRESSDGYKRLYCKIINVDNDQAEVEVLCDQNGHNLRYPGEHANFNVNEFKNIDSFLDNDIAFAEAALHKLQKLI